MTVGVPYALQLLIAVAATGIGLVIVDFHQVKEEASEGISVTLKVDKLVSNIVITCFEEESRI